MKRKMRQVLKNLGTLGLVLTVTLSCLGMPVLTAYGAEYGETEASESETEAVPVGETGTEASESETEQVEEAGNSLTLLGTGDYAVTVTADAAELSHVKAGETVTLTAQVTQDGVPVTDLEAAGLQLWWWTDHWNGREDGLDDAVYSAYDDNSGYSLTADVTVPSVGTYYIVAELQDGSGTLAKADTVITTYEDQQMTALALTNGDFETGDAANWTLDGWSEVKQDTYAANNTSWALNLWRSDTESAAASAVYTVTLTAGTYQFGYQLSGADSESGLSACVAAGETALTQTTAVGAAAGWDQWMDLTTETFTLDAQTEVSFKLAGDVPAGWWGYLDNLTLMGTGSIVAAEEDDTAVDAEIYVQKIQNLSDDFIMGLDISSVVSELESGVVYKDYEGNVLADLDAFCQFLAANDVTHIRVRVWNDPYDSEGNGYGGGNNDVAAAVKIAQSCANAGLKLLVDFHYSDFWADPGKQQAPKAWSGYTLEETADALKAFTTDALTQIAATGADVDMVQIGNETTGGIAGFTGTDNMCTLFRAGSAAVRAFDPAIRVVIHVTNPEKSNMQKWADNLNAQNVDYDILATSYYIYWHGSYDNLKSQMAYVKNTYGKDVMVAETSYAYTLEDTDGHDNTVRSGQNDSGQAYAFTVQGQANCLRDIMNAVNEAGGLGVFYWEPAWITVGDTTSLTGDDYDAQVADNKVTWETYGSGWASSYAGEYDADDAGKWFGGSAVDNQALFAADGTALESMHVWQYVKTGAKTEKKIEACENPTIEVNSGETVTLPDQVTVTYNDGSSDTAAVTWNAEELAAVDTSQSGTYTVTGTLTENAAVSVTATVIVKLPNLLLNPGFEESDMSMYTITGTGAARTNDDPYAGSYSLHFYNASEFSFTTEQTVSLEAGNYQFTLYIQGGDVGDAASLFSYVKNGDNELGSCEITLDGWKNWQTPVVSFTLTESADITVGLSVTSGAGGWGTIDEWTLNRLSDEKADTTALQAAVDRAKSLDADDYVADQFVPMQQVLAEAEELLADPTATQEEVDDMTARLTEAMDNLRPIETGETQETESESESESESENDPHPGSGLKVILQAIKKCIERIFEWFHWGRG